MVTAGSFPTSLHPARLPMASGRARTLYDSQFADVYPTTDDHSALLLRKLDAAYQSHQIANENETLLPLDHLLSYSKLLVLFVRALVKTVYGSSPVLLNPKRVVSLKRRPEYRFRARSVPIEWRPPGAFVDVSSAPLFAYTHNPMLYAAVVVREAIKVYEVEWKVDSEISSHPGEIRTPQAMLYDFKQLYRLLAMVREIRRLTELFPPDSRPLQRRQLWTRRSKWDGDEERAPGSPSLAVAVDILLRPEFWKERYEEVYALALWAYVRLYPGDSEIDKETRRLYYHAMFDILATRWKDHYRHRARFHACSLFRQAISDAALFWHRHTAHFSPISLQWLHPFITRHHLYNIEDPSLEWDESSDSGCPISEIENPVSEESLQGVFALFQKIVIRSEGLEPAIEVDQEK